MENKYNIFTFCIVYVCTQVCKNIVSSCKIFGFGFTLWVTEFCPVKFIKNKVVGELNMFLNWSLHFWCWEKPTHEKLLLSCGFELVVSPNYPKLPKYQYLKTSNQNLFPGILLQNICQFVTGLLPTSTEAKRIDT